MSVTVSTGALTVTAVSGDLATITVSGVNLQTADGGLSGATLRIVDGTGQANYRTIAGNTATTITVTDPWGTGVVGIGTQVYVVDIPGVGIDQVRPVVHDATTPGVVIVESGGSTRLIEGATSRWGATDSYTVRLTMSPAAGETITVRVRALVTPTLNGSGVQPGVQCGVPDGCAKVQLSFIAAPGQTVDPVTGDLLLTFDSTNWMTPQTVTLIAPANSQVEGQDLKAFPARERRVYPIQGPLSVFGGDDPNPPVSLSLDGFLPIVLPGESSGNSLPTTATTAKAIEAAQIDRLICTTRTARPTTSGR